MRRKVLLLPLLLSVASCAVGKVDAAAAASLDNGEGDHYDIVYQLDVDDDEAPAMEPFEYKYDADAIHAQWRRDLVWNDTLDQEIRQRHNEYTRRRRLLRLDAAAEANPNESTRQEDFIRSLYTGDRNEPVSCFIGYKTLQGRQEVIRAALLAQAPSSYYKSLNTTTTSRHHHRHHRHDFGDVNSIAVTLPKWKLVELLSDMDRNIDFVELDQEIQPNQLDGQVIPYGITLSQGGGSSSGGGGNLVQSTTRLPNNCKRQKSFKVGIIDAGYTVGHPDLSCATASAPNCLGSSFGLKSSEKWYNPTRDHGTHVAGTIGALGKNGLGVIGMVPDADVCYIIARVFGDDGGATFSMILAAVKWSIANGANVINMSLSGDSYDTTAARIFDNAFNKQNRIMVAATGNDGVASCRYPACYDSVLSVAAVDSASNIAGFSNFNNMVDLAAPGVDILSTVPGSTTAVIQTQGSDKFIATYMINSPTAPKSGVSGQVMSCGLGKTTCRRSSGSVCIMKRGDATFQEKALNCQYGGGVAAIIFNNDTGLFNGWIPDDGQVRIPVFGVDLPTGRKLRRKYRMTQASVVPNEGGYATLSGTSMATPHVTGAVAAIWRSCRSCDNKAIVSCLQRTAVDLGAPGKDVYYGHGLIQTQDAFTCLKKIKKCC